MKNFNTFERNCSGSFASFKRMWKNSKLLLPNLKNEIGEVVEIYESSKIPAKEKKNDI